MSEESIKARIKQVSYICIFGEALKEFYAAVDRIEAKDARIAELEAALRFYADKNSWVNSVPLGHPQIDGMTSLAELDKGRKARATLEGKEA